MQFINRELSWLEFNQRVLHQAQRVDSRLMERLKFLSISASNLDEFFQVRVGGLNALRREGVTKKDPSGRTPIQQLRAIRTRSEEMVGSQYRLLTQELLPNMAQKGIEFLQVNQLKQAEVEWAKSFFYNEVAPLLTPVAIERGEAMAQIPSLKLVVLLKLLDLDAQDSRFVLMAIPDSLSRFVMLPKASEDELAVRYLTIESLVATFSEQLFAGEAIEDSTVFRLTRNTDIVVEDHEGIVDLAEEMEEALVARNQSFSVRLEILNRTSKSLQDLAQKLSRVESSQVYKGDRFLRLGDFMKFSFTAGSDDLRDSQWEPQGNTLVDQTKPIFESISKQPILIHQPYESFDPVVTMLEEAARDEQVVAIKQVLYRTANPSRIVSALIKAAQNGKQVTALVELKARFDEANNLVRAEQLQNAGVHVIYGVKNFKTHAKICLIVRQEKTGLRRYVHLGTGNYNESTAKIYTDISYLTADPVYGQDASLFFNVVTGRSKVLNFQKIAPAPTYMKSMIIANIESEMNRAKSGGEAKIQVKVNSLQDMEIIKALHAAAEAGVDSADWMVRNLDKRVELMVPVEDRKSKEKLLDILDASFKDNTNAYQISSDGSSKPVEKAGKTFRSQLYFHEKAKRAANEFFRQRLTTFEPYEVVD